MRCCRDFYSNLKNSRFHGGCGIRQKCAYTSSPPPVPWAHKPLNYLAKDNLRPPVLALQSRKAKGKLSIAARL